MELVFFALELLEEPFDAVIIVFRIAFEDKLALLRGELTPGHVGGNALRARPFAGVLLEDAITRLGPGFDGAIVEGFAGIGDDEVEIEIDGVAKALAARASAVGIVEGEQARLGFLIESAVVLAFEALVEGQALGGIAAASATNSRMASPPPSR